MMVDSFATFFADYERFERVLTEYNTSFQFGLSQSNASRQASDNEILQELQLVEMQDQQQKLSVQHSVQEKISALRNILLAVDEMESGMDEPRYHQYKQSAHHNAIQNTARIAHSQQDINNQVNNTINSIRQVTNSLMPKSLASICSFFNPSYRHSAYRRIVENRDQLEQMIVAAEYDIHAESARLQNEISRATMTQVRRLQTIKSQRDAARISSNNRYFIQLKKLLLDGLEEVFCGDTIYGNAYSEFSCYSENFITTSAAERAPVHSLMIGVASQEINATDDGTLNQYLQTIVRENVYSNGNILLPVALKKYFQRPVCVKYTSIQNASVFPLFSNYALQLLEMYHTEGVSIYLVDCDNLGANYSGFTSVNSGDEDKRINIIRTNDELKKTLELLSEFIIDSNTNYLRNNYRNVEEYNRASSMKHEIRLLFISNISEITSSDMLNTLYSIIRNGSRCGIHTFVAISDGECQTNSFASQSRVSTISSIMDLCDQLCMSSTGNLSFGNGLPQLLAPPPINSDIVDRILNATTISKSAVKISLADHLFSDEHYFTKTCWDSIDIPIGLDVQGNEYQIHLSKDTAYMLIGGNPSSGKSRLLHTIILQCITRYSPDKLEIYLADLKDGCEFDDYAKHGVQSIKVVLDDAETGIALSFLEFIQSNVEIRLSKFAQLTDLTGKEIKKIEDFYEVNNEVKLVSNIPRMLLIIDEFQSLFDSSRETGRIANWLVRMCRTVGIYIIMASQRASGDASTTSSFSSQTKDFFIYRGVMKLPFSGAREIMSEHCSDTNRENPAIRQAQILKPGQIIINSNMGATEGDNRLVQCYFPENDIVSSVCDRIVALQGHQHGIILNSEQKVNFSPEDIKTVNEIVFGESNQLLYDACKPNSDAFHDNYYVSIDPEEMNRLLILGSDNRVSASIIWSVVYKLCTVSSGNVIINILDQSKLVADLLESGSSLLPVYSSSNVAEFLQIATEQLSNGKRVVNLIANPSRFSELCESYSDLSDEIVLLRHIWSNTNSFNLIINEQYKTIKENCAYCDADVPCRVISVGNLASIRSAMTMDAAEQISESPFNIIRPNVIKAYYYNKLSDKTGRFRLFDAKQIVSCIPKQPSSEVKPRDGSEENGYAGLVGN